MSLKGITLEMINNKIQHMFPEVTIEYINYKKWGNDNYLHSYEVVICGNGWEEKWGLILKNLDNVFVDIITGISDHLWNTFNKNRAKLNIPKIRLLRRTPRRFKSHKFKARVKVKYYISSDYMTKEKIKEFQDAFFGGM